MTFLADSPYLSFSFALQAAGLEDLLQQGKSTAVDAEDEIGNGLLQPSAFDEQGLKSHSLRD